MHNFPAFAASTPCLDFFFRKGRSPFTERMFSSVFDLGPQWCQALTLLTYRCHWGNLVVTLLALSSVEKAGDVIKISAGQKQAPWTQHEFFTVDLGSFAKSHPLLHGKTQWKAGILACSPWLPASSSNNGNITMGYFLIMWTAIWNVSNISHAWYTLLFPVRFRGARLSYDGGGSHSARVSQPATMQRDPVPALLPKLTLRQQPAKCLMTSGWTSFVWNQNQCC